MRAENAINSHGRQLGRVLAEVTLSGVHAVRNRLRDAARMPHALEDTVLLLVLLRDHARVAPFNGGTPAPRSINSIAESLQRPYETIRRHVHMLDVAGALVVREEGAQLGPALDAEPFLTAVHNCGRQFLADLGDILRDQAAGVRATNFETDAVTAFGIDLCLIPFEVPQPAFASWTEMAIFQALAAASIRGVTDDDALSARFGAEGTPPPPALRRPVHSSALAAALELPVSTVHRHILAAGRSGKLTRSGTGIVPAEIFLASEAYQAPRREMNARALHALARLRSRGLVKGEPDVRAFMAPPARLRLEV